MTGQLGAHLGRRRWHLAAENVRKTDAGLLEYSAICEDPASAATSGVTPPVIAAKFFFTVGVLERMYNALLQRSKVLADFPN